MAEIQTVTVWMNKNTTNAETISDALRQVADKIEQGYTGGYNPSWELEIDEEK